MDENTIELVTKLVIEAMNTKSGSQFSVPVGVSARHVHLTQNDVEILFGKGYELTKKKDLMGGQFASNELVTIVGTKLRAIENVRILGPARKVSQVEIAQTDTFKLGINTPLRQSGDIKNSAPISLVGPKGVVYLEEGCIVARSHIHMSPEDARQAGLNDNQIVSVKFETERPTTLDNVLVRVDPSYTLEMHIDTDEANAGKIRTGDCGKIVR